MNFSENINKPYLGNILANFRIRVFCKAYFERFFSRFLSLSKISKKVDVHLLRKMALNIRMDRCMNKQGFIKQNT